MTHAFSSRESTTPSIAEIYELWFTEVVRWVNWLGGPAADREDLAQDVFVIAQRRLPDFDGENLPGWLYQITRNRVRDYRRLCWTRAMKGSSDVACDSLSHDGLDPADQLEARQRFEAFERQLQRLTEHERAALLLMELDGCAGEEIAEVQGVPLNTVWSRIRRGRAKLLAGMTRVKIFRRIAATATNPL